MVDGDHLCLSLPPQSGIGLLVQLQAPCQSKPDQDVSTLLDVQTVAGRGRILLFPAKAHSLETICLFFAIEHDFDFLFYRAVIADYHDMTLGEVIVKRNGRRFV